MHTLRFPFAAASGLFVALAVFYVLAGLVSRPIQLGEIVTPQRIEFTRKIIETPIETKPPQKVARPPPPIVPPGPRVDVGGDTGDTVVLIRPTNVSIGIDHGKGLQMGQDRDVIPIVRPPPEYPAREAARGVEGWVKVQFSITAIGTVRDPIVVDAEPKGAFEDAALKAIARWRYNPKVEGGVAVERVGLQTVIRFQLEK